MLVSGWPLQRRKNLQRELWSVNDVRGDSNASEVWISRLAWTSRFLEWGVSSPVYFSVRDDLQIEAYWLSARSVTEGDDSHRTPHQSWQQWTPGAPTRFKC